MQIKSLLWQSYNITAEEREIILYKNNAAHNHWWTSCAVVPRFLATKYNKLIRQITQSIPLTSTKHIFDRLKWISRVGEASVSVPIMHNLEVRYKRASKRCARELVKSLVTRKNCQTLVEFFNRFHSTQVCQHYLQQCLPLQLSRSLRFVSFSNSDRH